jgi:hypothetical protein
VVAVENSTVAVAELADTAPQLEHQAVVLRPNLPHL